MIAAPSSPDEFSTTPSRSGGRYAGRDGDQTMSPPAKPPLSRPAKADELSMFEAMWLEAQEAQDAQMQADSEMQSLDAAPTLTWSSVPADVLDCAVLPNQGALEIRRQKNRECMRRARQRQREELNEMKHTVKALEKQYSQLCLRSSSAGEMVPNEQSSKGTAQLRYAEVVELVKRLGAENLYLKASLQDQMAWKLHLHRILDSMPELRDGGKPSAPPMRSALNFDTMDPEEAFEIFDFVPLTEQAVTRLIVQNTNETQGIYMALSGAAAAGDRLVNSQHVVGWDVLQRIRGSMMEYVFTKTYTDLNIMDVMRKMWMNDMDVKKFRKVKYDVRRLEVLQVANPNAYILGRDVSAPDRTSVFRSVFMRFLIEVNKTIPDPANPDGPPLNATGYLIGTHSVNRDWSEPSTCLATIPNAKREGVEPGKTLEWADLTLCTEFLNVTNPTTGEQFQQIQWIGRTDYKAQSDAIRNASDTLTVCLRTELLLFRPALHIPFNDAS